MQSQRQKEAKAAKEKKYGKQNQKKGEPQGPKKQYTMTADGCFSPKRCHGNHASIAQRKRNKLRVNAEALFKNLQIKVVETEEECQDVVRELISHCEEYNVLGFSRYSKRPVALLQLASHRGLCALIRLCKLKKIPHELQQLLEDEKILKVGVRSHLDGLQLVNDYGINRVAGALDVRILAEQCGFPGLPFEDLCVEHLEAKFNEYKCIPDSNWEYPKLETLQKEHAAKEVYASLELFKTFAGKLKPKPINVDQKMYIKGFIDDHCVQYLDVTFTAYRNIKPILEPEQNNSIHVIKTVEGCQAVTQVLKSHCDEYNVLGMKFLNADVGSESEPARIDLLQLATHRGLCATIFLNELEYILTELLQILNDRAILKVGVNPMWNKNRDIRIAGTLDLNYLLSHLQKEPSRYTMSRLCKQFLNVKFNKNPPNDSEKIEENYAKNEALLAFEVFKFVIEKFGFENETNQKKNLDTFIKRYCLKHIDVTDDAANMHF